MLCERNTRLAWMAWTLVFVFATGASVVQAEGAAGTSEISLEWKTDDQALPDLPDELGVAGPFVGVHNDALIVAGGANFPKPVWENGKVWRDRIYVLTRAKNEKKWRYDWKDGGTLPQAVAYGAAVSTPAGVVCLGGNYQPPADPDGDGSRPTKTFQDVFVLKWTGTKIEREKYPSLPKPCAYGQATSIGNVIYLAGGQSDGGLDSAMTNFWALDLAKKGEDDFVWEELAAWPGESRAFNLTVSQHNGYDDCVYLMSGRRQGQQGIEFLSDVWEYNPKKGKWRERADSPRCVMAGTGIGFGQSHILVLGGADGSLLAKGNELKDAHPGFPKEALAYHTITDTWTSAGSIPKNHVTTVPVMWDDRVIIASGEVRPRVRSPKVWSFAPVKRETGFGWINYSVLIGYLAAMVGVGVFFAFRNKSTDDYFRGGMHIPWWAAGCSIFATMLSSLTFTALPSKSFAQDWVYAIGNFMIPLVAFVAVYVALPFYRRIDATSAYEFLEKRFNRFVRLFGSSSFTVFHVFRMAVVMSLTGLALAVATPLTPMQSVLLMGVLSILYCTMGGIEAVIWTDTIQTVVLLGGAFLALVLMVMGTEGGLSGSTQAALDADKFHLANFHLSVTSAQIAVWVIVIGAIGQNVSTYTADQAVVQRYMTTPDQKQAARSIWASTLMTIPATLLFFGIGTALFAFYRSHPSHLDPTIMTDQIFPYFIANEMPIGIAGLIVAGIFSAAQSTVSTSMNSTATTIVTDFLRPADACKTEKGYLTAARAITFVMGVLGTLLALLFISPDIRSMFDQFLKVVGMFTGVLGGLFVLGVCTRRANAFGAIAGAVVGTGAMVCMWSFTDVNAYLYTVTGITVCVVVGYLASLAKGGQDRDLDGLTLFTID